MFRRRRHHKTVETLPEVNTLRNPAQVQLAVSGVTNLQCEKVSNTQKEKDDKKCAPPISCPTASSTINVHECTTSQGVEKFTVGNSADLQAKSISTDQGSKSYTDHYISNVATAIDNERRANFVQPVMYTKRSVKARKKTSMHQKQSDQCPRDSHINRLLFGNPTDVHNGDDSYSLLANITFSSMSFPQPAAAFKYKQSQQYDSNAFIVPKQTTAYLQGRLQSAVRETSIGSTIIQDKQVDLLENSMSCLGLEYTRNLADRLTISDSRPTISSMDCSNRLLASNCPLQPYSQLSSINKCPSEPPDNANCTRQVTVVGSDKLAFGLPHDVVPPQRHRHLGRRQISRSEGDLKDVEVIFHHSSKVITNATDNIQYSKSRSPRSGSVPSCETQVNTSPHTSGDPAAKTQILAASVALNENTTKSYTMQPEESASELVIEPFPRKCIPARKCCSIVEKNTHELQPTSRTINSEGKGNVGGIRKKRIPCMVCSMPTAQRETTADELLPINEFDDIVETERRMVLDEVISTETKYLKQLLIIKEYNVAIRATNVLAEELMDIIIPECIDHLIAGHTRLLRAFETCATVDDGQPVSLIGDVFRSDASEFLKSYVYYIADLQRSIVALQQHVRDSEDFAAILADTDKEMEQNLGLASFLLTPIQRLPRYVLLLQALLSVTPRHSEEHAALHLSLVHIERLLKYINACYNVRESQPALQSLYRKMKKLNPNIQLSDLGCRRWLLDSPVSMTLNGERRTGRLFLFNDILLLAKEKNKNKESGQTKTKRKRQADFRSLTYQCSVPRQHARISGRTGDMLNIQLKGGDVDPKGIIVGMRSRETVYLMVWTMALDVSMP